ncbi:MAG: LCP family protein [Candidatus Portnoybacteria bacterium]|nr:LCP family protein [Candidatus Portnoybacteria bacterium]MDD4982615.1 LCP family protein [Candidatus Portnoybacteria bacterium]
MYPAKKTRWRVAIIIAALILTFAAIVLFSLIPVLKMALAPHIFEIINGNNGQSRASFASEELNSWPFGKKSSAPANFLLLGAPGEGNDAPDLTDTILLARLDPVKNKIYLFSLPRDLLVKLPDSEKYTKLNALYAFNKKNTGREFDALIQKARDITGLEINHYVFVDLQTVKQLVDIFGGVNVMVAKDITDTSFPGPNHSFQTFEMKAGWRYLDGETALKYMRSRHSSAGDFDRVARQQEVLQALKQKVLSLHFWDIAKFTEIYSTLSAHIKSDLTLWQIKDLWRAVKDIPGENVVKSELNDPNLIISGQMELGGETASILQPKDGVENYESIKKYIADIINQ